MAVVLACGGGAGTPPRVPAAPQPNAAPGAPPHGVQVSRLPPGLGGGRPAPAAPPPASPAPVAAPRAEIPRLVSTGALPPGERIADLAAIERAGRTLVAWVTYVDPPSRGGRRAAGADGARRSRSSKVLVQAFGADGDPAGTPVSLSSHAEFVGGVALAPAAAAESCLAWVGREGAAPQVFLTKLGPKGEKLVQRVVSRQASNPSEVALARVDGGFVVIWADEKDGEAGVYATRVDDDLRRVAERRIAHGGGVVSGIRAAVQGADLVLAWSNTRGEVAGSDVFTTRLSVHDLGARGEQVHVAGTSNEHRGLELAFLQDDLVLGWIETPDRGAGADAKARAMLARLSPSGRSAGPGLPIPGQDPVNSLAIACGEDGCRVVLGISRMSALEMTGLVWNGVGPVPEPVSLARWGSAAPEDPSPAMVGDWLYLAEDVTGAGRVGWMKIAWQ